MRRRALIYFHGGGGFAFTAKDFEKLCNRYAYETDTTIINVDYCKVPEFKPPCAAN
jgi:acetyl esterase/lipase